MYTRRASPPEHSFFLFGPWSTGKSTWLRHWLPEAAWFDLLRSDVYLPLLRDPASLRRRLLALPAQSDVVIDEVQRLPLLLSEVHAIIAEGRDDLRFALSGSSARKLRRRDVDLFAGRVFERHFFPMTVAELAGEVDVERLLAFGGLPQVCSEPHHAVDSLEAYVSTYLRQEIQQEALVKDLGSFHRFLEVAVLMNGQVVNTARLARDAAVARPTVQRFFDVLVDTLVGSWLPAYKVHLKVKQVRKSKFYFFDPGVVRAILGLLRDPVEKAERGVLLETVVLNELRAHIAYARIGGELSFYRTPSGSEIDFIWSRAKRHVAFEVKSASTWRREWSKELKTALFSGAVERAFGIYLGREVLADGPVEVLPLDVFARRLDAGEVLGVS
ncbi:MAG: ATP-binding protein [Deltaproteobacteria bacterium]|nr:ATP-binding protein [Deltaproteobacteria bacterium]